MVRTNVFLGVLVLIVPLPALAESPAEIVVGTWYSQDGDKEPLIFRKDGTFECGFLKQDGKWRMAKGTYTVSAAGKIEATADIDQIRLGRRFRIENGAIVAPRGPTPRVEWKKEKR